MTIVKLGQFQANPDPKAIPPHLVPALDQAARKPRDKRPQTTCSMAALLGRDVLGRAKAGLPL